MCCGCREEAVVGFRERERGGEMRWSDLVSMVCWKAMGKWCLSGVGTEASRSSMCIYLLLDDTVLGLLDLGYNVKAHASVEGLNAARMDIFTIDYRDVCTTASYSCFPTFTWGSILCHPLARSFVSTTVPIIFNNHVSSSLCLLIDNLRNLA